MKQKNIGYKSLDFFHSIRGTNLKRDLLIFDEIFIDEADFNAILEFAKIPQSSKYEVIEFNLNEILYLNKEGYIKIEYPSTYLKNLVSNQEIDYSTLGIDNSLLDKITDENKELEEIIRDMYIINLQQNLNARNNCAILNENGIFNIKPILEIRAIEDYNLQLSKLDKEKINAKKSDILNIVLNKMPIPDDTVSWEKIIDFKNNSDFKFDRLNLLMWISEIGNSSLSIYEIEQKLEYLLAAYEDSMKKNKLKYHIGAVELIVTTTLEVMENVIKLNWSKAAKSIFNLKQKNVDLLIGETKAPGREVAYISKINSIFQ